MKSRMEELSDFYDANLDDPKAQFLEKLRLKLKRALAQQHHLVKRIESEVQITKHSSRIEDTLTSSSDEDEDDDNISRGVQINES